MAAGLGVALAVALAGLGARGGGPRLLALAALVGVMVQGLLGGFRVRLNELVGADLAAVHGVFAQVVFSLLACLAVLTAARREPAGLADEDRQRLRQIALLLAGLAFLQLVWGVLLRHAPSPLAQRGHLLTAFAVVAAAVWLVRAVNGTPAAESLASACAVLVGLLTVQVLLGVEAWLGKFAGGDLAQFQSVTTGQAVVRTAHVLVGTGVLAVSVVLAVLTQWPAPAEAAGRVVPAPLFPHRRVGESA
jgi:heme A synthase